MNRDIFAQDMYERLRDEDKKFVDSLKLKGLELGAYQLLDMYPYINRQLGTTTINIIKLLRDLIHHTLNSEKVFIIDFCRTNGFTRVYVRDVLISSFLDVGSIKFLNLRVREIISEYFKEELSIISVNKCFIEIKLNKNNYRS